MLDLQSVILAMLNCTIVLLPMIEVWLNYGATFLLWKSRLRHLLNRCRTSCTKTMSAHSMMCVLAGVAEHHQMNI